MTLAHGVQTARRVGNLTGSQGEPVTGRRFALRIGEPPLPLQFPGAMSGRWPDIGLAVAATVLLAVA